MKNMKRKCSVRMCHKDVNQDTTVPLANGAVAIVPLCWAHAKDYMESL